MVLLQDGPGLDGGEGPPHYEFHRAAVQPAEGARADAGDKRILNGCRWGLPFRARAGISSGAMRTLNDGEQGDGGQEFDFHSREGSAIGIKCRTGRGAKLSMRGWASITWQL